MTGRKLHIYFRILSLLGDIIVINLAFYLAYWIRFYSGLMVTDKGIPPLTLYTQAFGIITLVSLIVFKISDLYDLKDNFRLEEFPRILQAVTLTAVAVMAITFLYRQFTFSRIVIFLGWFLNILLVSGWRFGFYRLRKYLRARIHDFRRVLIVGTGKLALELYQAGQSDENQNFQILGLINCAEDERKDWPEFKGVRVYNGIDSTMSAIEELKINQIVMTTLPEARSQMLDIIIECERSNIEFKIIPDILEIITTRSQIDQYLGLPVLSLKPIQLSGFNVIFKRIFDIFLSFMVLIIIAIPLFIIALLIKLDSPGPVFYKHQRMGYKGRKFNFLKFRSMVQDADDKLKEVIHMNDRQGPVFKMKNDPRITKIGKFLRHYSLDELPQFINVLKGDMSIVGPRPQVLWEAALYDEWAKRRLMVLPGITGLWQVSGRSNLSFEEMIKLDIYYIENWSLWLDIVIILQTVPTVLFAKGAY
ncbi:MAG: sugar transferase [bacterium]|nr:sugar transferase [bacterium]